MYGGVFFKGEQPVVNAWWSSCKVLMGSRPVALASLTLSRTVSHGQDLRRPDLERRRQQDGLKLVKFG